MKFGLLTLIWLNFLVVVFSGQAQYDPVPPLPPSEGELILYQHNLIQLLNNLIKVA